RWVHPRYRFFLPVKVLSRVFRGKFVAGLKRAFRHGTIALPGRLARLADATAFRAYLRALFRHDWVVYVKPPFGGPEHVLHYLARYTHRVAISNHRLVNVADDHVTFRWKNYAHGSASKADDRQRDRIPAAILVARPPARLRADPLLWLSGESAPSRRPATLPSRPRRHSTTARHDTD